MKKLDLQIPGDYECEYLKSARIKVRHFDMEALHVRLDDGELRIIFATAALSGLSQAAEEAQKNGFRVRLCFRSHGLMRIDAKGHRKLAVDWAIGRFAKNELAPQWDWSRFTPFCSSTAIDNEPDE